MRKSTYLILFIILLSTCACGQDPPIGFGRLNAFEKLPMFSDYYCAMESSYDRTGGNKDGNNALRIEDNIKILADLKGPGCIYRIWMTNPGKDGRLKFYFDGEKEPRIDTITMDFFGKHESFKPPFSTFDGDPDNPGRASMFSYYCYLPIPFEKSLKITGEKINFHHINYETYEKGTELQSYSGELTDEQKELVDSAAGIYLAPGKDPKPQYPNTKIVDYEHIIPPGGVIILAQLQGPAIIDEITFRSSHTDERSLRGLVINAWWDDEIDPSISSPIGDFFGTGFGQKNFKAMPLGMDGDRWYCYFPMPFDKNAVFELQNETDDTITISGKIRFHKVSEIEQNTGKFHAAWRRENPTIQGESFTILAVQGRGVYLGCNLSMQMRNWSRSIQFLEGDERIYIDGEEKPRMSGTGAEDYFNGSYYWDHYEVPKEPFHGVTEKDLLQRRVSAYRYHIIDPVYFTKSFKINIEHGPVNNWISDFSGTAYWYQSEPHGNIPQLPPVHERMPIPKYSVAKVDGAMEAEDLLPPVRFEGQRCTNRPVWGRWQDWCHQLSGNSAVRLATKRPRRGMPATDEHKKCSMTLAVPVEKDGQYEIIIYYVFAPNSVKSQLLIDGKPVGNRTDLRHAGQWKRSRPVTLGTVYLEAGKHEFTFDGEGQNQLMVDCIVLRLTGPDEE